ncbi:MAG TPA: class I SAM-dependent methyltransferase [Candidatus Paceibacterota bacterium]
MEDRKIEEIRHYNEDALAWRSGFSDIQGANIMMMESYQYVYKILRREVPEKTVLDYGCGHGMHSVSIARFGGRVTGVDLSEESLKIAKARAEKERLGGQIQFVAGDCEALPFTDQSFDIVFDIVQTEFFHFFSMFAFPFRNLPGGKMLFCSLDKIDNLVLKIPFLKRYGFKIVFVFKKTIK